MLAVSSILSELPSATKTIYLAFSGGIDSCVLLHLLATSELRSKLVVVHVNHRLQSVSDEWEEFCSTICTHYDLTCHIERVEVDISSGTSIEESARDARYAVFKKLVSMHDVLLTAHHCDDQAETFILQLLRGAGVAGLAAMAKSMPFASGRLVRPLLHLSRNEIEKYAQLHNLSWVEDPSNLADEFDRNYLRLHVLPIIQARWASANKTIARSAQHCADAMLFIDDFVDSHLTGLMVGEDVLDLQSLAVFGREKQVALLRSWFRCLGLRAPSRAVMESIQSQFLQATIKASAVVYYSGCEFRCYRQRLHCIRKPYQLGLIDNVVWNTTCQSLILSNGVELTFTPAKRGILSQLWCKSIVEIRSRQGGERIKLPIRQGSHSLKNLYQEVGIPPWLRDRRPLIYINGQLAAVAGLWVAEWAWGEATDCIQISCSVI